MAGRLSKNRIIGRDLLTQLAQARLEDARQLLGAGRYAGAVYLAGYAVECELKAAICAVLDVNELPETFAEHDLELLLLFSGLEKQMKSADVHRVFSMLYGVWKLEKQENVRYINPSRFNEDDAKGFLTWVEEVVKWIKARAN